MKAVFLSNGDAVPRIYPEPVLRELDQLVDLNHTVLREGDLPRLRGELRDVEAVFTTWGMPQLNEEQIAEYLPNLKVIFYGAGSVQYFARPFLRRGIAVSSAWAVNGLPVIEFCTSLIYLSLKGFFPVQAGTKADWAGSRALCEQYPGAFGSTVGLLGLGMIGRGVAERLQASDIHVIGYDPFASDETFARLGMRRCTEIGEVFAQSDLVSNHIANLPTTKEILRYEHFSAMGPYGTFLNTGRNGQVHVPGLIRALQEVPTRTAYFDVTDPDEPPSADNPLLAQPNVYLTPHVAGTTGGETARMGFSMAEECRRFLAGEGLRWGVSEAMLATMA